MDSKSIYFVPHSIVGSPSVNVAILTSIIIIRQGSRIAETSLVTKEGDQEKQNVFKSSVIQFLGNHHQGCFHVVNMLILNISIRLCHRLIGGRLLIICTV